MSKQSFSAIFASLARIFFALTLFSFPFSLRHIFYEKSAYLSGMFTETTAIFINTTEILLWLTVGFYLFSLSGLTSILNRKQTCRLQILDKPERHFWKACLNGIFNQEVSPKLKGVLFLFFLLNILTAFWSRDPVLSLLFSFKILEGIIFAYLLTRQILQPRQIVIILGLLCLFEGGLALEQFYLQHDLGLKILGESHFNAQTLGVAKIDLPDHKIVRSYGTFPHPNLLAAFFVIVFFYLDSLNFSKIKYLLLIPLFFTFSRSAFLAIFIGLMVKIFCHSFFSINKKTSSFFQSIRKTQTPLSCQIQSGIQSHRYSHLHSYQHLSDHQKIQNNNILDSSLKTGMTFSAKLSGRIFRSIFPLILLALFFLLPLYYFFPSRLQIDHTIWERFTLAQTSLQMFFTHPWGVGNAHFLYYIQDYAPQILKPWEFMPVHNLYLLILNENGILGLLVFFIFISLILKQLYRNNKTLLPLFCAMLTLALFDHYFWDIDQGRWLFWLAIGMII